MGKLVSKLCNAEELTTISESKPEKKKKKVRKNHRIFNEENTPEFKYLEDLEFGSHVDIKDHRMVALEEKRQKRRSFKIPGDRNLMLKRWSSLEAAWKEIDETNDEVENQDVKFKDILEMMANDQNNEEINTSSNITEIKDKESIQFISRKSYDPKKKETEIGEKKKSEVESPSKKADKEIETELKFILNSKKANEEETKDKIMPLEPRNIKKKKTAVSLSLQSHSSYHTCQNFDSLTIGSLISSSRTKQSHTNLPFSKSDLFTEFISEMENINKYFNFSDSFPMEEILMDEKIGGEEDYLKSVLITFCPEIRDNIFSKLGIYFKKRIIKSRCLMLIKADFEILKILLNKNLKVRGEEVVRRLKMNLKNKGDFNDLCDSLMSYSYKIEKGLKNGDDVIGDFRTVRIGSEKIFPNKKRVFYIYERSQNLNKFYDLGRQKLNLNKEVKEGTFMLKSVVKFEAVSRFYTRAYIYNEMFYPENIPLKVLRKLTLDLHTSSYTHF